MSFDDSCAVVGAQEQRVGTGVPFETQDALIDANLEAVRRRLRVVGDQLRAVAKDQATVTRWPAAVVAGECELQAQFDATLVANVDFPLVRLAERLALGPSSMQALWLLLAHELCPVARQLVRDLATEQVVDPTTDVVRRAIFGTGRSRDAWLAFEAEGELRRWGLIERTDGSQVGAEHRQTWRVARRVLGLAYSDLRLDPALNGIASLDSDSAPLSELEANPSVLREIESALDRNARVVLVGKAGTGRRTLLCAIAAGRGLGRLIVDARAIARDLDVARRELRCVAREARFLQLVPIVLHAEALEGVGDVPDRIGLIEEELAGLVLASASRAIPRRWKHDTVVVSLRDISSTQLAALWSRALPMATATDIEHLVTNYPLAPGYLAATGRAAIAQAGAGVMTEECVAAGLHRVLDDRLVGLASRVTVLQTWDDVVLPRDQHPAISELMSRVRERRTVYERWGFANKVGRGLGVAALFSGPPGTGKTMLAGLVAKTLGLAMYQVDLSKIVSKWIGETEKNLAALFDAAEAGHAVLLFDEADALFGKRTDVRSSNDRHANQEVNFLLQRLESFKGVCILTTNHETAIDQAFQRRISIHLRFNVPEPEERLELWRALLPAEAPFAAELGLEELARTHVMSGGYIKNAVIRAAFLAADEGRPIDAKDLARAARLEYEAMGKLSPSVY